MGRRSACPLSPNGLNRAYRGKLAETADTRAGFHRYSLANDEQETQTGFTAETAALIVKMAEYGWNSKDPQKAALAHTPDSIWRNRSAFLQGRDETIRF